MRRLVVLIAVVAGVSLAIGSVAAAAAPTKSGPVKLKGKVNNKGAAVISGDSVDVEMDNYYFKKTFLKATPGSTVAVQLENEGNVTHNFSIDSLGIDQDVEAGAKATVQVTLPASTKAVAFYCKFHKSLGMQGAIFTRSGGTAK
jgi:plastocyanin